MAVIVPVYNSVILPQSMLYLQTESYRQVTKKEPAVGDKVILLAAKKELTPDSYSEDDFYELGVSGSIVEVNASGYVAIRTEHRVSVESLVINDD